MIKYSEMLFIFIICMILGSTISSCVKSAKAHDWYDQECCHSKDCAVVTKIEKAADGELMTSVYGTFLVRTNDTTISRRPSQDNQIHICAQKFLDKYKVICVYYPALY